MMSNLMLIFIVMYYALCEYKVHDWFRCFHLSKEHLPRLTMFL